MLPSERVYYTYMLTAPPTFQLDCLSNFVPVVRSACVTLVNSLSAARWAELSAGGIVLEQGLCQIASACQLRARQMARSELRGALTSGARSLCWAMNVEVERVQRKR